MTQGLLLRHLFSDVLGLLGGSKWEEPDKEESEEEKKVGMAGQNVRLLVRAFAGKKDVSSIASRIEQTS